MYFGLIVNVIVGTGFFGFLSLLVFLFLPTILFTYAAIPYTYSRTGLILSIVMTIVSTAFSMLSVAWVWPFNYSSRLLFLHVLIVIQVY